MTEEKKVGFLRQYFVACFQPRNYRALLERKMRWHVLYFIVLLLFMLLVDSVIPIGAWVANVGGFRNFFTNRVPAFTLENGELDLESPMSFNINGSIHIRADSTVEAFTEDEYDSDYDNEVLFGKTNLVFRSGDWSTEYLYSSLGDVTLDNEGLAEFIPFINLVIVFYLLLTFVYKVVRYLFLAIVFGLLCRFAVRSEDRRMVPPGQAILIGVYAKTLFGLVNSLNICLNYFISDFVLTLVSFFFAMYYIVRVESYLLHPEST